MVNASTTSGVLISSNEIPTRSPSTEPQVDARLQRLGPQPHGPGPATFTVRVSNQVVFSTSIPAAASSPASRPAR